MTNGTCKVVKITRKGNLKLDGVKYTAVLQPAHDTGCNACDLHGTGCCGAVNNAACASDLGCDCAGMDEKGFLVGLPYVWRSK